MSFGFFTKTGCAISESGLVEMEQRGAVKPPGEARASFGPAVFLLPTRAAVPGRSKPRLLSFKKLVIFPNSQCFEF